jgi:hypothetical protein
MGADNNKSLAGLSTYRVEAYDSVYGGVKFFDVVAKKCEVIEGLLVFYQGNMITKAFNKGSWYSVERVD